MKIPLVVVEIWPTMSFLNPNVPFTGTLYDLIHECQIDQETCQYINCGQSLLPTFRGKGKRCTISCSKETTFWSNWPLTSQTALYIGIGPQLTTLTIRPAIWTFHPSFRPLTSCFIIIWAPLCYGCGM